MSKNNQNDVFTFSFTPQTLCNDKLFMHAACYTAAKWQKGYVQVKRKDSDDAWTKMSFGPTNGEYVDMANSTMTLSSGTTYTVEVSATHSDSEYGTYTTNYNITKRRLSDDQFNEVMILTEDLKDPDDVNDTVIRLVWFEEQP